MPPIFRSWNFELSEERDWPDDPAPRLALRWLTSQLGAGRCGCGRCLPDVTAAVEIEEEEIIGFIRAVFDHYGRRAARRNDRARRADKIRADVDALYAREITFLERWEAELRGRDWIFED